MKAHRAGATHVFRPIRPPIAKQAYKLPIRPSAGRNPSDDQRRVSPPNLPSFSLDADDRRCGRRLVLHRRIADARLDRWVGQVQSPPIGAPQDQKREDEGGNPPKPSQEPSSVVLAVETQMLRDMAQELSREDWRPVIQFITRTQPAHRWAGHVGLDRHELP